MTSGVATKPGDDPVASTWEAENQSYLVAALAEVAVRLEAACTGESEVPGESSSDVGEAATSERPVPSPPEFSERSAPPAIETVCAVFGLSPFERAVLLLCAGVELDARIATLVRDAQAGSRHAGAPTFALAMAAFPGAHWSALTPGRPLRYWRLVERETSGPLLQAPLCIDEWVLHFIAGVAELDPRWADHIRPRLPAQGTLVPAHADAAERLGRVLHAKAAYTPSGRGLAIELIGGTRADQRGIVSHASAQLGCPLYELDADFLPSDLAERGALARLWEREAALSGALLYVDQWRGDSASPAAKALMDFVTLSRTDLVIGVDAPLFRETQHLLQLEVDPVPAPEVAQLWARTLGSVGEAHPEAARAVRAQFALDPASIEAVGGEALALWRDATEVLDQAEGASEAPRSPEFAEVLWEACRRYTRPRIDNLARRIVSRTRSEDLVLPEPQRRTLDAIATHARNRWQVYDEWGFSERCARGLGISALFHGPSGTGKTMAAEALANQLHLDLLRIDLSRVVSKYIGETEKNLASVFDAAESGGAVLLFDEADALFGKRSEVKDSHDRFANIEVGYLLQRMEEYRGLAILTTNMRTALDSAFLRRIRFVVPFLFPEADEREEIWRRAFPPRTPLEQLDYRRLAQLHVAGGSIRNIALNAAFLAADEGRPVNMAHLRAGAEVEFAKLERSLTRTEVANWT